MSGSADFIAAQAGLLAAEVFALAVFIGRKLAFEQEIQRNIVEVKMLENDGRSEQAAVVRGHMRDLAERVDLMKVSAASTSPARSDKSGSEQSQAGWSVAVRWLWRLVSYGLMLLVTVGYLACWWTLLQDLGAAQPFILSRLGLDISATSSTLVMVVSLGAAMAGIWMARTLGRDIDHAQKAASTHVVDLIIVMAARADGSATCSGATRPSRSPNRVFQAFRGVFARLR